MSTMVSFTSLIGSRLEDRAFPNRGMTIVSDLICLGGRILNDMLSGSYGSLPLPVLAECAKLSLLSERNPDRFHRVAFMPVLEEARYSSAS